MGSRRARDPSRAGLRRHTRRHLRDAGLPAAAGVAVRRRHALVDRLVRREVVSLRARASLTSPRGIGRPCALLAESCAGLPWTRPAKSLGSGSCAWTSTETCRKGSEHLTGPSLALVAGERACSGPTLVSFQVKCPARSASTASVRTRIEHRPSQAWRSAHAGVGIDRTDSAISCQVTVTLAV
jgi:hypothetical protein